MRATQFCALPAPVGEPTELARVVAEALDWLLARQNGDGSWGRESGLDKLICTTHAFMTLICAGFSPSQPALSKALTWLQSGVPAKHNNSYWILGPLAALDSTDPELLAREFSRLEMALLHGAKPYPHQLVEAFYLRALAVTDRAGNPVTKQKSLEHIRSNYDPEAGWFSRSDSTSDGYAALYEFDPNRALEIKLAVKRFLLGNAQRADGHVYWGSEVSTAYTMMNIICSDLVEDSEIRLDLARAAAWLKSRRLPAGYWSSDPPFGGTQDIKSPDFPTAVALRALLAFMSLDGRPETQIFQLRMKEASAAARRRGHQVKLLWFALILTFVTPVDVWVMSYLARVFSTVDWAKALATLAALISLVCAILGLWFALDAERVRLLLATWRSSRWFGRERFE